MAAASAHDCVFCSIIAGDVSAHWVLDTEHVVAFLDHRPLFKGHTLVMPRAHIAILRELEGPLRDELFARTQEIAAAVQDAMGAQGSFVAMNNVVSQSVPHLHVHAVPRTKGDGLRGFFWPRGRYEDDEDAAAAAAAIRGLLPPR
ncbi:MAG: HIT family protein [Acidimicrobiia bacterium]